MRRAVLLSFLCWFVPIAAAAPQDDRPVGPVLQGPPAPQVSADAPADERVQDAAPVVVGFGFEGPSRYDVDRMRETLGVVIGTRLDDAQRERIARGMESLWATGMVADVEYQVVPGGIELRLVVTELPLDLSPRFVGNERVDDDDVVEWAGLRRGDEVRFSQARTIALQLEERYHQEGYYFASVRAVPGELVPGVAGGPPEQDIIFEIDEGPKVRVRALRYSGNDSLPIRGWGPWASGLRHEASPKLRGPIMRWLFGSLFSVPFRKDRLDEDVVAMREAYRRLGYLDAVVQVGELEFSDDRSWVTIHLVVDEGEPYIVTSVRVAGFQRMADQRRPGEYVDVPTELLVPEDELLALCKLERGDRLLRYEVESDGIAFARRYGSMGHIAHSSIPIGERFEVLEPELVFAEEGHTVDVTYRIAQGTEQRLREIRITGNERTQDRVPRRELGEVFEGDVADLVKIERGIARLRGVGYFSSVSRAVDHHEPTYRFREVPGEPGWKDLDVILEEGDQIRFDFGVVYGTDNGLAGQIGVTFQNFDIARWPSLSHPFSDIATGDAFRGAGQTLRLFASPGTDVSRYQVLFSEPDLFGRHLDRIGSTVDLSRGFRGYRTHDEQRDSIGVSLFKQLDPDTRISLGYRTTTIDVDNVITGTPSLLDPLAIPDFLADQIGESRVSGLELGLSRSVLDNALGPRDGYSLSGSIGVNDSVFGSDYDYVSFDGSYDLYGSFYEREETAVPGYRVRLRASTLLPYGDTDNVPYTERLFLGGSRLMRGFDFRGVGPNQRGHAIGGESMLAGSVEYLWPLLTQSLPGTARRTEVFRGGFFVDAGILDVDAFTLDPGELRLSAGFTVGMVAPIPIALNFGFPLIRDDGDRRRTFSFSIQY